MRRARWSAANLRSGDGGGSKTGGARERKPGNQKETEVTKEGSWEGQKWSQEVVEGAARGLEGGERAGETRGITLCWSLCTGSSAEHTLFEQQLSTSASPQSIARLLQETHLAPHSSEGSPGVLSHAG